MSQIYQKIIDLNYIKKELNQLFRHYSTHNLISEIERELKRSQHLVQLLIDEYDFHYLGNFLITSAGRGLSIEIGVISSTDKKSMKFFNLSKTLIDLGVEIYWCLEQEIFNDEDYFALFDKSYVLTKNNINESLSEELIFKQHNDLFNAICSKSEKLNLNSGPIEISFQADESILYKNQTYVLAWDVKNAHEISIDSIGEDLSAKDSIELLGTEDIKYTLVAKNKDTISKKSVFVKVIKDTELKFYSEGYDEILKDFVSLNPIANTDIYSENFAVYRGQKIKISWSINVIGKLIETNIGNMPLKGTHEFEVYAQEEFCFTFKTLQSTQFKKIIFHPFDSEGVMNALSNDEIIDFEIDSLQKEKSLLQKLLSFLRQFLKLKI